MGYNKKQQLHFNNNKSRLFEITMILRDKDGNPTGRTKTYSTNSSDSLHDFYMRNRGKPKRKHKKKAKEPLPNRKQAEKILKEIYSDGAS